MLCKVVNAVSRFDKIQFIKNDGAPVWFPARYSYFVPGDDARPIGAVRSGSWWRIDCKSWEERKTRLQDHAVHFEGDVNPIRRWFVDNPGWQIDKPRACYLDLEADSRCTFFQHTTGRSRVLCWAVQDKATGQIFHEMLAGDNDADERVLLAKLWDVLKGYTQYLAWNGGMVERDILKSDNAKHGFDNYVLIRRSNNLGVLPSWWREKLYLDHLATFRRNNMNSGSADERVSFSLENIGQALVGRGKTGFDSAQCWQEWAAGGTRRQRLGEYNIGDVVLEADIEKATKYLDVFQSLCEVCKVFPDTAGLGPQRQVDGLMLAYGQKMDVHFKTKEYKEVDENAVNFEGAYCDGPHVDGVVENVHVADFKGLYPSIMMTMNISPELLGQPGITCPVDAALTDHPITFANDRVGVLPACVADMIKLREHWKQEAKKYPKGSAEEQEAARKSMAYKMANNSFMGVNSSPYSRYYHKDIGLAICRTGVALIQAARDEFKAKYGWKVIYIDTDSLNVPGPTIEEFKTAVDKINTDLLPGLARSWGCTTNTFFLEYEKAFQKVLFAYDVKGKKYARKKYIYRLAHKGFTPPKPGSEVGFVGIEMKRGDSSKLARKLQRQIIDKLMSADGYTADDLVKIIENFRVFVYHTNHPVEDVLISKSITKPLESYDGATAPNVTAARMMQAKGQEIREGTKVQFVVVKAKGRTGTQEIVLAEDYTGELDREFLWTHSVYPGSYRLVKAAFKLDPRFDKFGQVTTYERAERAGQQRLFE